MKTVRIITPTGHLGATPLEKASFERGYEWTLNHAIEVADPRELFRTRLETVGA